MRMRIPRVPPLSVLGLGQTLSRSIHPFIAFLLGSAVVFLIQNGAWATSEQIELYAYAHVEDESGDYDEPPTVIGTGNEVFSNAAAASTDLGRAASFVNARPGAISAGGLTSVDPGGAEASAQAFAVNLDTLNFVTPPELVGRPITYEMSIEFSGAPALDMAGWGDYTGEIDYDSHARLVQVDEVLSDGEIILGPTLGAIQLLGGLAGLSDGTVEFMQTVLDPSDDQLGLGFGRPDELFLPGQVLTLLLDVKGGDRVQLEYSFGFAAYFQGEAESPGPKPGVLIADFRNAYRFLGGVAFEPSDHTVLESVTVESTSGLDYSTPAPLTPWLPVPEPGHLGLLGLLGVFGLRQLVMGRRC